MITFVYYLSRESENLIALRQTRFKAQHLAGKSDERDICAFARDTDEMRTMLEHVRIDTDNVDWTEP